MARSDRMVRKQERQPKRIEEMFDNFRNEVESSLRTWHAGIGLPLFFDGQTRLPLCDMGERGNAIEIHAEVPGIDKNKIHIKASRNAVEMAADQSEKLEEKRKNYLYSERSHRSFYRRIPVPQEIVPSKTEARMNNGIIVVKLLKKNRARSEGDVKEVEVK